MLQDFRAVYTKPTDKQIFTNYNDNCCVQEWKVFWPQKDTDTIECGSCQVAFQSQSAEGPYGFIEFLLQSTQVCDFAKVVM